VNQTDLMTFTMRILLLLLGRLASSTQVKYSHSSSSEDSTIFTQNPVCVQQNCINPITPGLTDLPRLEGLVWQCTNGSNVKTYARFCSAAIDYDAAIPSPVNATRSMDQLVQAQDSAASTMYYYHLAGMGLEGWENVDPSQSSSHCIKSLYQLTCYTYFPKQEANCAVGKQVPYSRPCRNACQSYLNKCEVECCDNSAQCVFDYQEEGAGDITGYVNADGPSALCTGSGSNRITAPVLLLLTLLSLNLDLPRRGGFSKAVLVALLAVICACSLQGCQFSIPSHSVPNWLKAENYLLEYSYVPPGGAAALNSCGSENTATEVCSGRGHCEIWQNTPIIKLTAAGEPGPLVTSFCKCDPAWTDPECRTRRKSQIKAFFLSIFTGLIGLDRFYLGQIAPGIVKLLLLLPPATVNCWGWSSGGWVTWVAASPLFAFWLLDIVRTGCAPVYGRYHRVQNDLPHWVFVLIILVLFSSAGLLYSVNSYSKYRNKRRAEMMHIFQLDESVKPENPEEFINSVQHVPGQGIWNQRPAKWDGGYGSTLPPYPNASPVMR